jgi:cytochrome c oxidase subunit 3
MPNDPFSPTPPEETSREPSFRMSTPQLWVVILFVAIGVLFAATLVAYLITRAHVTTWRVAGNHGLPGGLAAATFLLACVSWCMQWAVNSIRRNQHDTMNRALWLGGAFATAFLVGQGFNWLQVAHQELGDGTPTLFAFTFYLLTGLHAAHVLGGFVPLGIVLQRASNREYSSSRYEGVKLCVQYWHYLGVIWLILVTTMLVAT